MQVPCSEEGNNAENDLDGECFGMQSSVKSQPKLPPICSHTECTPDDVMLMTLAIAFRHKLTYVAVTDIFKMINTIYSKKVMNISKGSLLKRLLKDRDQTEEENVSYHYYCDVCMSYVKERVSPSETAVCDYCGKVVSGSKEATYFASLSFKSQLKDLFESDESFPDMILNRFDRLKDNADNLEDIYDGSEYKKNSSPGGILSSPYNFSYSFFTDGVAVGKTKKTMWPIYVTINELPLWARQKFIMLVGLYYGPCDPDHRMFLKPFVEEGNSLASQGFSWNYKGVNIVSKVIPTFIVTDSVARCQVLNMQTFSAYYGCTFCYQQASRTTRRLKFTLSEKRIKERTLESYQHDLRKAYNRRNENLEKDRHGRGVKGPSSLGLLEYFDLTSGAVIDYMHNILLGVTKTYFELVLDHQRAKFWEVDSNEVFAMDDVKNAVDERLLAIKPPSCISRTPRSISDCGSWKANEWRSWLLFYNFPSLCGLLKKKHLSHISILSKGTYLLLQRSVSRDDVSEAHDLYMKFVFYFQKYFGPEHMYYNIHLLTHVCKGVLRWGPLFTHNAFMYESYNRNLLHLVKNPYRVVKEVSNKYTIMKSLPKLTDNLATNEDTVFFCQNILDQKLIRFKETESCILLGQGKCCDLSLIEIETLLNMGFDPFKCLFYDRLVRRGMRITTVEYSNGKKNCDSVFYVESGEFYEVLAIFTCSDSNAHLLARKKICSVDPVFSSSHVTLTHLQRFECHGNLKLLQPESIQGEAILIKTSSGEFLTRMPLSCYDD